MLYNPVGTEYSKIPIPSSGFCAEVTAVVPKYPLPKFTSKLSSAALPKEIFKNRKPSLTLKFHLFLCHYV